MNHHPMSLAGKVAVVTGGNGGIGLGIARGIAGAGCNVAIWARNREKNERAVESLHGLAGQVKSFECDVTDRDSAERAMRDTLGHFGQLDGMFANAGIGGSTRRPFLDRQHADWEEMLNLNLFGAFHASQLALLQMKRQAEAGKKGARLILTSSIASRFGTATNEHYALTKAAVNSLAKSLAVEFARFGVTANAILPGYTATEMTTDLFENEKFTKAVIPRIPMRRFGKADDFAGIAIYLMSDLSAYHTGDLMTIDGGYSIY